MNTFVWIIQGVLGFAFFMAGVMKLIQAKAQLREKLGDWVDAISDTGFKIIGLLEVLGAIGIILPMAINYLPILTVVAAIGLALTMVGAMVLHLRRGEIKKMLPNIVLFLLSAFVALGRFVLVPVI